MQMTRYVLGVVLALSTLVVTVAPTQQVPPGAGVLRGVVRDAESGRPLGGVSVSIVGTPRGTMTAADGGFEVGGLAAGALSATFQLPGYTTVGRQLRIEPAGATSVEVELRTEPYALAEVVVTANQARVASKTETPVLRIPQSVQVVPQAIFREQQARELDDVLRNVSGATYNGTSGGNFQYFHLRGFYLLPTSNFRRNGVEVNAFGPLLAANVDRVEVLKGPSSVLYGNLNPGGVVNLVTKQPQARRAGEVEVRGGSFGFVNPRLDLTGALTGSGTLLGRLNLSYDRSESFRDDVESNGALIAPVLSWRPTYRTSVTVEGEYSRQEKVNDPGIVAPGDVPALDAVPSGTFLGEPEGRFNWRVQSAMVTAEHQLTAAWRLRGIVSRADYHRAPFTVDVSGLAADNRTVNRSYNARTHDLLYTLGELNVIGEVSTGPATHSLLVGADMNRTNSDQLLRRGAIAPVDYMNPSRTGVPAADALTLATDTWQRDDRLGLFAQDQIRIGERVDVLVGFRFTRLDRTTTNRLAAGEPVTTEKRDEKISPRLGVLVALNPSVSLFGSFSTSFVPVYELDRLGNSFNPMLGTQYEAGIKVELLEGRLAGNATAYQLTQSEVVSFLTDTQGFYAVQGGIHRGRGFEVDLLGSLAPGWSLSAGYAFNRTVVVDDPGYEEDRVLAGAPDHNLNVWTTYELPIGVGVGGGVYHVGAMRGFLSSRVLAPAYTTADATVFAHLLDRYTVRVGVRNLLDERYYSRAFSSATASYTNAEVGAPRSVVVTLGARF